MTKKGESRLQKRIQDRLRADVRGFWVKIHGGPFQMTGIPDLVGCVSGLFFAFEVKDPDRPQSKLSPVQREVIKRIQDAGGIAGVVDSPLQAVNIVRLAQQATIDGSRSLSLKRWLTAPFVRSEDG